MSYMRFGTNLRWFEGKSEEYIYGTSDTVYPDRIKLCDWKHCVKGGHGDEQWIELVGRILYRETTDREFCNAVVEKLAKKYKVTDKLRHEYIHPMGYKEHGE
jgi:hypothetical protein